MKTNKEKTKFFEISAFILLIAISLGSPIIVHYFGLKGTEYLPIFFALSLGSYILNPISLITLSIISPLMNSIITGMPQIPILYFLIFEGVIFSILISLLKNKLPFFILSPLSFIIARFSSILLVFLLNENIEIWFNGIVNGYKGIIVNSLFSLAVYFIFKNRLKNI
ncbi:hypothetical protein EZH24_10615 [Brachyspira catarrhinii]|uniref:ECF transporter S component n=1 Tax=Brachyspira catarrhinii TaxID=2528966 RepID=A0ABY2TNF4_9SPIR|nr:hypothetical protein EZH24_10615 [Brachyspira catarrhinii]